MKCYQIWYLLLVLFVIFTACAVLKPKENLSTYTWANFFNKGCGPVTEIIISGNQKATLVYNCLEGEEITQSARLYKIKKGVRVWAIQQLPYDQLYNLSNGKCQASLLFEGSYHTTINFTCALLSLTVGYDISSRVVDGESVQIHLIPTKVLITYGDGNQEFSVDGEELIPIGPFKHFPKSIKT